MGQSGKRDTPTTGRPCCHRCIYMDGEDVDFMAGEYDLPVRREPKVVVTIRLDRDLVDRWRATGKGWQTRVNEALRRAAP